MPNRNRGKERDEKELRGRARCAEGKRMNEWADGRDGGGVGGGKGNEQSEKRGKREQTRAERPGEEEKSRTDCDRCICTWLLLQHKSQSSWRCWASTYSWRNFTSLHLHYRIHTKMRLLLQTDGISNHSLSRNPLWDSFRLRAKQSDCRSKNLNNLLHREIDSCSDAWTLQNWFTMSSGAVIWWHMLLKSQINKICMLTTLPTILMQHLLSSDSHDALWIKSVSLHSWTTDICTYLNILQ